MTMRSWMSALAAHYEQMRQLYPHDNLMILFDIDGTIIDMRYMMYHVLRAFDYKHNTTFFSTLQISDITVHENQVEQLLVQRRIPSRYREKVLEWYQMQRWSSAAILESHRPFRGLLEVIRWFQIQPNTAVGLNTGRPECLRAETLRSLNTLGREYRVSFPSALLYMNPKPWGQQIPEAKVAGVQHFRDAGYRSDLCHGR